MAKDYPRHIRIGDQLQRELAALVRTHLKDPRIESPPTIVAVNVSADLGIAYVYFNTLFGEPSEICHILNAAAGHLRHELGKRLKIRTIPVLQFRYDTVQESAAYISALIDQAVAEDKQHPDYDNNDD